MKFANDDFDVHTKVVFVTQDFYHPATRVLGRGGPVGDFDVDDHAFEIFPGGAAGSLRTENSMDAFFLPWLLIGNLLLWIFHARRDDDFLRDLLVNGRHEVAARAVVKNTDNRSVGAGHGTEDASFGAAIGTDRAHLDQDEIAVHGEAYRGWRNENVAGKTRLEARMERGRIGCDKTETVAMHVEFSHNKILIRCGIRMRNGVLTG